MATGSNLVQCPLPTCKYDDPLRASRARRQHRNQQAIEVRLQTGATITALAERFHITQRTVYRILAQPDA